VWLKPGAFRVDRAEVRPSVRRSIGTVLGVGALAGLAFYAGGVLGYAQGVGTHLGVTAPGHAVTTVAVLSALRKGKEDVATEILEADLDADILTHAIVADAEPSAFDLLRLGSYAPCLLSKVATYRRTFPSRSSAPQVRGAIARHLSRYGADRSEACTARAQGASSEQAEPALREVQRSQIEGHAPSGSDVRALLQRGLASYFASPGEPAPEVEIELLREGPTQSGVAYAKYYVWVRVVRAGVSDRQGAARVAAVERERFEVTHFLSAAEIRRDPSRLAPVFPAPVAERIREKLRVGRS
jgi:hypothetical protein